MIKTTLEFNLLPGIPFEFLSFDIVSSFVLRYSDLYFMRNHRFGSYQELSSRRQLSYYLATSFILPA